jgi:Gluconate 2-dehydrogenase subunit 3
MAGVRSHPPHLPEQRRGITPQMRGRYPNYDVLAEAQHWDEATRKLVLGRVSEVPQIRFFSETEAATLRAFCDTATAQDREPRIPVLEMVDAKLHSGRLDGFRYADLPEDPQTWRAVAEHLDGSAREAGHASFAAAPAEGRQAIVACFARGELDWPLPVKRAWTVVMRAVLAAFYSHPWAWNEIGFGGPAYPRGFARVGPGQREPWERGPQ